MSREKALINLLEKYTGKKVVLESAKPMLVYRMEHFKNGEGPFNMSYGPKAVLSSYTYDYISDRIGNRFKVTDAYHKLPKSYVFGFDSLNSLKKAFLPKDLKFLLGVGFIITTYKTGEYKALPENQIAFNKKTATIVSKTEPKEYTDEQLDLVMDKDY